MIFSRSIFILFHNSWWFEFFLFNLTYIGSIVLWSGDWDVLRFWFCVPFNHISIVFLSYSSKNIQCTNFWRTLMYMINLVTYVVELKHLNIQLQTCSKLNMNKIYCNKCSYLFIYFLILSFICYLSPKWLTMMVCFSPVWNGINFGFFFFFFFFPHFHLLSLQKSSDINKMAVKTKSSTLYEFYFPSELCGRLIGRQGKNIIHIKERSGASVSLQPSPYTPNHQICTIEGKKNFFFFFFFVSENFLLTAL